MAPTPRDEVWHAVLKQLVKTGRFRISDLPFDESRRHTARRVLRAMEDLNWLSRESERAATWRLGENAEMFLNISAMKIKEARK